MLTLEDKNLLLSSVVLFFEKNIQFFADIFIPKILVDALSSYTGLFGAPAGMITWAELETYYNKWKIQKNCQEKTVTNFETTHKLHVF
jgi:hypothetical protein